MLLRSVLPALLAVAAELVHAQGSFSSLASCGQQCINNMDTSTGCVPVTSECLCSNVNFFYGIADCANKACTSPSDASAAVNYASASCSSVLATSTTAAAATSETPATTETPTTTESASPTEAATTSSTAVQNEAASTATSSSATDDAQTSATTSPVLGAAATNSEASTSATATSEASGASPTSSGASSASTATGGGSSASSSTSASSASSTSSTTAAAAPGLSTGSKVGIVIGSAAGAVAMVALVLVFSRKRGKTMGRNTLKISEPLPGSGRIGDDVWEQYHAPQYSPRPPRTAGSNMSELDKHARPYDEMVPRITPARMV